jgi:DNA-binding transcriptional MerR regulator
MGDEALTHKDLADRFGVSETTIKNYRRKFPGFFPLVSRGKPLRFRAETADVCRTIREGFDAGLSAPEIRARLEQAHPGLPAAKARADVTSRGLEGVAAAISELASEVRRLADGQERIMERLQALKAGSQAPVPEQHGRTVRIRTREGGYRRYSLERIEEERPGTPAGPAPEPRAEKPAEKEVRPSGEEPDEAFLSLPMVVRTEQGEFLGVPGKSGHLSIRDFIALLRRQVKSPGPLPVAWQGGGENWTLLVELGSDPYSQDHVMGLTRTVTPRGNQVVWLKSMSIGGKEVPESFLSTFLKQLRRELSE